MTERFFIAVHQWNPEFVSMQDLRKGATAGYGSKFVSSGIINDKALGMVSRSATTMSVSPCWVTLLASSPSMKPGGPTPSPSQFSARPAERIDAIVEMTSRECGCWLHGRRYACNGHGCRDRVLRPARQAPVVQALSSTWDYYRLWRELRRLLEPDERFNLAFKKFRGRGGFNRWTITQVLAGF